MTREQMWQRFHGLGMTIMGLLKSKRTQRLVAGLCFASVLFASAGLISLLSLVGPDEVVIDPFPLGVDPVTKTIVENPAVDEFFETGSAEVALSRSEGGWLRWLADTIRGFGWYQNLATPTGRTLVIESGERREEVADNFANILGWNDTEEEEFLTRVASSSPELVEGKYFPSRYLVAHNAGPQMVADMVVSTFEEEVGNRYTKDVSEAVPLEKAITFASLLEREAYSFEDMRYISGIVWNRLFIDMNLQLDASLQYAKGSLPYGPWWPVVRPSDKYIDSPFNTYQNTGLPPAPIANPSLEAIVAALNPKETDCLFYFHDSSGAFHCSPTYEGHVAKLREIYGRGR